jgi:long-subunit fatty acid transport protein
MNFSSYSSGDIKRAYSLEGGLASEISTQSMNIATLRSHENLMTTVRVVKFDGKALAASLTESIFKHHSPMHRGAISPYLITDLNNTLSFLSPLEAVLRELGMRI